MGRQRRGRGEGGLHRRKQDGLWCAYARVGGKRVVRYARTKAEALVKLRQIQQQTPAELEAGKLTLAAYLERWLGVVGPTLAESTRERYARVVRTTLLPVLRGEKLAGLTALGVADVFRRLEADCPTAAAARRGAVVLAGALAAAVRPLGLLATNPAAGVPRPRHRPAERRVWTPAECLRFLEAARADRLYALYVLALTAGLRQGELLGLDWSDVDLAGARLTVRRSLRRTAQGPVLVEPKTRAGRRLVLLPAVAVEALRERASPTVPGAGLVFPTRAGTLWNASNLRQQSFRPLIEVAGVPRIAFHDLRHTSATLLLLAGVHPKVVQERLGHASIRQTLETYSHVLPSMQEGAARQFERLFEVADRLQ